MKKLTLKPVALAAGLALAAPAFAAGIDFSGSNIYMKFLDGNQRTISNASGDTASGADQGQWTEFELRMKVNISKQVEAGVRLQSRSPASYWTNFGFANNEGFGNPGDTIYPQQSKYVKLRGAYVLLTPGYNWLDQALIGSSDWGMFDPFTIGQVRYIDRDNYNGLYFKGKLPLSGATYEFGRLSLPNYLQVNYGQGPTCCGTDATQYNEAVYIGQLKGRFGPVRMATSYQWFDDTKLSAPDNASQSDGQGTETFAKNKVFMLRAEGSVMDGIDVKGAFYRSTYEAPLFDQPWINGPKSDINDNAYKLDVSLSSLLPGLQLNYQYFNVGAGYFSNTAARRETDVLLTEGSEASWFKWGNGLWLGGAYKDYQQAPSSAKCFSGGGGVCRGDSGLREGANGLVDNDFIDFDEAPNESVQGWKGHTVTASYEIAKIGLSGEYSNIGYNYNWQNYSPTGPLSNFFNLNNDRKTSLFVARVGYVVPVMGGIELGYKYKMVDDKNKGQLTNATDDRDTKDSGHTFSAGNQLFGDLYGKVSYGIYKRDISKPSLSTIENDKRISSIGLAYNLAGFETGVLAQWVTGDGDPREEGTLEKIDQYRMKAFVKAIF